MHRARTIAALAAVVVIAAAPVPAWAGTAPSVTQVIEQARNASTCSPLTYSPELERAAEIINRSTSDYLDHTGENIPADDPHPMPILTELGIEAENVHSLQGAGHAEADAIKGLTLQGYKTIPDCAYTEFGTSGLYEPQSGYFLVVAVLVQK
ncbi:hypothetical protein [Mycolicibacterium sp. XJ879]